MFGVFRFVFSLIQKKVTRAWGWVLVFYLKVAKMYNLLTWWLTHNWTHLFQDYRQKEHLIVAKLCLDIYDLTCQHHLLQSASQPANKTATDYIMFIDLPIPTKLNHKCIPEVKIIKYKFLLSKPTIWNSDKQHCYQPQIKAIINSVTRNFPEQQYCLQNILDNLPSLRIK